MTGAFLPAWLLIFCSFSPLLSALGYSLSSLEHLAWMGLSVVLAAIVAALHNVHRLFMLPAVLLFSGLAVDLYFIDAGPWYYLLSGLLVSLLFLHQEKLTLTIFPVFALFFSLTAALMPPAHALSPAKPHDDSRRADLAPIIHIMVDGHVALDNLQADPLSRPVADMIGETLKHHGFHSYPGAYSEQLWTHASMLHSLNSRSSASAITRDDSGNFEWMLQENELFQKLHAAGYAIHVTQPDYINYCHRMSVISECSTYRARSADYVKSFNISPTGRTLIALGLLERSIRTRSRVYYAITGYPAFRELDTAMREHLRPWIATLGSMQTLKETTTKASGINRGEYHFVHLLMPHQPYAFDSKCQLVSPERWLNTIDYFGTRGQQERTQYRQPYTEQIQCLWSMLDDLFSELAQNAQAHDAWIIVHSDHGSRVAAGKYLGPDENAYKHHMDWSDYHSALLAVKSPARPTGVTDTPISIQQAISWQSPVIPFRRIGSSGK